MKYLPIIIIIFFTGCRKTETQYSNDDNKRSTVNDKKSDTIKTLPEVTRQTLPDSADTKSADEN